MPEPESESESSQVGWCTPVQAVVGRFLAAVEARDPDAVAACCAQDATYRNVPHPPAVGRDAIRALFARILDASSDVRWYLVSAAWSERCGHLERIDRFRIGGIWHEIECHGVWEVDPEAGLVTSVRDYLDLGVWHERLGDALG
jgi:limonene-1,2-epoxide hydrolase